MIGVNLAGAGFGFTRGIYGDNLHLSACQRTGQLQDPAASETLVDALRHKDIDAAWAAGPW